MRSPRKWEVIASGQLSELLADTFERASQQLWTARAHPRKGDAKQRTQAQDTLLGACQVFSILQF